MGLDPPVWFFSDARYAGGAEQYLDWILDALGPARSGLVAVDHAGLTEWIDAVEGRGHPVERLRPAGILGCGRALRGALRRRRARVVHVNLPGPYDGLLATAPFWARTGGANRVIVTEHLPGVGRVGRRFHLKRATLGAVDQVIALCEPHARLLHELFGYAVECIRVIHNGVPAPQPTSVDFPGTADCEGAELRILQVGALDERKGGPTLLRAAAKLKAQGLAFRLWFLGEGPERESWRTLAAELGLAGRVHFPGRRSDVHAWLAGSHVVVLASTREGMPLSLLEAMAHGKPVVASRVDGIPELVGDDEAGLLVPPEDEAALAHALRTLALDEPRRTALGRAARARFEQKFTHERMIRDTLALYEAG